MRKSYQRDSFYNERCFGDAKDFKFGSHVLNFLFTHLRRRHKCWNNNETKRSKVRNCSNSRYQRFFCCSYNELSRHKTVIFPVSSMVVRSVATGKVLCFIETVFLDFGTRSSFTNFIFCKHVTF
jgi:hypothetical protein